VRPASVHGEEEEGAREGRGATSDIEPRLHVQPIGPRVHDLELVAPLGAPRSIWLESRVIWRSLGTPAPRPPSSGEHRPLFVKQHPEGGTRRYPLREASKLGPALRVRRDVDVAKMHETRDDRDIRDRKALTD